MTRQRLYLILVAALCVALCAVIAAGTVSTYLEGSRAAVGEPVFTRERLIGRFAPALPILLLIAALAVAGRLMRVRKWTFGPKPAGRLDHIPAASGRRSASGHRSAVLRAVLVALALGCVVAGIANGSMRDVLVKAVNICTECVGLG